MDMDSLVHGFRCHFNDRESIPTVWIPGKDIPCLIDGPGGERIIGIEVLWSDTNRIAGLSVGFTAFQISLQELNEPDFDKPTARKFYHCEHF